MQRKTLSGVRPHARKGAPVSHSGQDNEKTSQNTEAMDARSEVKVWTMVVDDFGVQDLSNNTWTSFENHTHTHQIQPLVCHHPYSPSNSLSKSTLQQSTLQPTDAARNNVRCALNDS